VLDTAVVLGRRLRLPVVALHVRRDGVEPERLLAARAAVERRLAVGVSALAIVSALGGTELPLPCSASAATRATLARRARPPWPWPASPWWCRRNPTTHHRPARIGVLVRLDGTPDAARAVEQAMRWLAGSGVAILSLHVFDTATVSRLWDRPEHHHAAWSREFLARNALAGRPAPGGPQWMAVRPDPGGGRYRTGRHDRPRVASPARPRPGCRGPRCAGPYPGPVIVLPHAA
jgi:hypothetical protein